MIFVWLLLLIPLSLALEYLFHAGPIWIFTTSILAIVPLAEWIRRATEHLAARATPAVGGLLNVTFGNTAEFILALFVLGAGHSNVVKGQITGSIIGNSLLGLGLAILAGSWRRERQCFQRERAGLLSSLLILAMIGLLVPALFDYTERGVLKSPDTSRLDENLSLGVATVLILVYLANLIYTLVTHREIFAFERTDEKSERPSWQLWQSLGVLLAATVLTAWQSELISGALDSTASQLGVSRFFLGVVVLAIVGNAAEYVSAVYFARRDRMDLVMSITAGSSIQVALLVAPLLVIVSFFIGTPMNLVFENPLELIAIAGVTFAVNAIAADGETTWFEGVLLLATYVILAMAFFFVGG
jgi:Ca2+:H+ antiporter